MDNTKIETAALEETINKAIELQLHELNDLQLVLIGGGSGDTILA